MDPVLASLLLDLSNLSDEQAEELTYNEYIRHYMDPETGQGMRGERQTHDGQRATFYADRFQHAFFTTPDPVARPFSKSRLARNRAARVRWIREIIAGNIPSTSCWHIPAPSGGITKRLYVLWPEHYLIWLNSSMQGGWKFSSAYPADHRYIKRKTRGAVCCWRKK